MSGKDEEEEGGKMTEHSSEGTSFSFEVLITTDDLHLQEMTSVPRRDAPGFL